MKLPLSKIAHIHRPEYEEKHQQRLNYPNVTVASVVVTTSDVVMCQMRHSDGQRVYYVYGSWMAENVQDQVSILNQR